MMQRIARFLVLLLMLVACSQGAPQNGERCSGDGGGGAAPDPASVGQVSWPGALYLPSKGVAWPGVVLGVDGDGKAELLLVGLADAPAPGHPTSITVSGVPCLAWAGPAALERPQWAAWVFPEVDPAMARPGVLLGTTVAGLLRVVVGGGGGKGFELPRMPEPPKYPVWVIDPSTPLVGDSAAAWAKACRKGA